MMRSLFLVPLFLTLGGCAEFELPKKAPPPDPEPPKADGKKVNVGKNIWLEVLPSGKRQVVLSAEVCLTEGPLELFLTRKGGKEHEAILAADLDAREVHKALLLAGANPGSPVRWDPQYLAATGTRIEIQVTYTVKGVTKTVRAQDWVQNAGTKLALQSDWVFAGSLLVDDPAAPNGGKRYLANEGDVIAIANFEAAMLDLPIESSKSDDDRGYYAWTERIPPKGTRLTVTLTPVKGK